LGEAGGRDARDGTGEGHSREGGGGDVRDGVGEGASGWTEDEVAEDLGGRSGIFSQLPETIFAPQEHRLH